MNSVKLQDTKLIYIYKSVVFLYTNNKQSEREIKKIIPFIVASKKNKIPSNKPKEVKDLPVENYKTLLKETEDDTSRRIHRLCSWTRELIWLKLLYYPRQSTYFM